jgi:hypothetical protein
MTRDSTRPTLLRNNHVKTNKLVHKSLHIRIAFHWNTSILELWATRSWDATWTLKEELTNDKTCSDSPEKPFRGKNTSVQKGIPRESTKRSGGLGARTSWGRVTKTDSELFGNTIGIGDRRTVRIQVGSNSNEADLLADVYVGWGTRRRKRLQSRLQQPLVIVRVENY